MAGNNWLVGFRKRNREIALRKAEDLFLALSNRLNRKDVTEYFNLLKEIAKALDLSIEERKKLEQKRSSKQNKQCNVVPKINRPRPVAARKRLLSESSSSEHEKMDIEHEQNNSTCGFCSVKYSDPRSEKLGDRIQCMGGGKEWYHEHGIGAKGKKKSICGKCRLND
ncbi:hypothetical protein ANN_06757 [Periplaneta americana]|uniref:HTH CENPB-type domain-containing protein n=1 Tax=Periplaneta americana TaxID=6978 RepID=A0ABQ8TEC4_PERAM|nr:hypothetical protein ANN_06757 [Periplaneta americana]